MEEREVAGPELRQDSQALLLSVDSRDSSSVYMTHDDDDVNDE